MKLLEEINALDAQDQQRRVLAAKEYAQIIARANESKKGDAGHLTELMKILNLTAADVTLDAAAVAEVRDLEAKTPTDAEIQQKIDAHEKAWQAFKAAEAEAEKRLRELNQAAQRTYLDRSTAEERQRNNGNRVAAVRKSRPLAFGLLPEPVKAEVVDLSPQVIKSLNTDVPMHRDAADYRPTSSVPLGEEVAVPLGA